MNDEENDPVETPGEQNDPAEKPGERVVQTLTNIDEQNQILSRVTYETFGFDNAHANIFASMLMAASVAVARQASNIKNGEK